MCNDVTKLTFYQNNGRRRNSSNAVGIICFATVLITYEYSSDKVIKEKNLGIYGFSDDIFIFLLMHI